MLTGRPTMSGIHTVAHAIVTIRPPPLRERCAPPAHGLLMTLPAASMPTGAT